MTAWGLLGLLEVAHLPIPNVNIYIYNRLNPVLKELFSIY